MMFIVLGVLNATAGSMITALTGVTRWLGVGILSVGIIYLVFKGTVMIERVLSFWSYVLYAVYIVFMIVVFVEIRQQHFCRIREGRDPLQLVHQRCILLHLQPGSSTVDPVHGP